MKKENFNKLIGKIEKANIRKIISERNIVDGVNSEKFYINNIEFKRIVIRNYAGGGVYYYISGVSIFDFLTFFQRKKFKKTFIKILNQVRKENFNKLIKILESIDITKDFIEDRNPICFKKGNIIFERRCYLSGIYNVYEYSVNYENINLFLKFFQQLKFTNLFDDVVEKRKNFLKEKIVQDIEKVIENEK